MEFQRTIDWLLVLSGISIKICKYIKVSWSGYFICLWIWFPCDFGVCSTYTPLELIFEECIIQNKYGVLGQHLSWRVLFDGRKNKQMEKVFGFDCEGVCFFHKISIFFSAICHLVWRNKSWVGTLTKLVIPMAKN